MNVLSHERAYRLLHQRSADLSSALQAALAEHLTGCQECREYAGYLKALQPALSRAMHARWDSRRPSSATSHAVQQRWEGRKMKLQAIKLTALVVGLGLVVVLFLYGPTLLSSLLNLFNINPVAPLPPKPTATLPTPVPTPTLQDTSMTCGSLAEPLCSVEQAEALAGFDVYAPTSLPDGITFTGAIAEPGKSSTLIYRCGDECRLTIFQNKEGDWVQRLKGEGIIVGNHWGTYAVDVHTSETGATRQTGEPATADQVLQFPANSRIQGEPFGIRISMFGSPAFSSHLDRIGLIELAYHTIGIPFPSGLIAFETNRDGNQKIYAGEFFDPVPTNLTNHPADDHSFAWSPDVERIAFLSDRSGALEVYMMRADGSNVIQLTQDSGVSWNDSPAWSPDGERLALTGAAPAYGEGASLVYLVNTSGSGYSVLSYSPISDGPIFTTHPLHWSPDGQWIAYIENFPEDSFGYPGNSSGLKFMAVEGGKRTKLHRENLFVSAFDWSPDGEKLAYASTLPKEGDYMITVENADGSNPETDASFGTDNLTSLSVLTWSPDGAHLAFILSGGSDGGVNFVDYQGRGLGVVGLIPSEFSRLSWSPTGRLILFLVDSEGADARHDIVATVLGENFLGDRLRMVGEFASLEFSRPVGADNTNPQWQPRP